MSPSSLEQRRHMNKPEPRLALIAAVASNGAIGKDGGIPWHIPEDLRNFRRLTEGHPIVMGAGTFASLPAILPGRPHIVVTSRRDSLPDGVHGAASPGEALDIARKFAGERIWIVGGQSLYSHFMPMADEIRLTRIDAGFDGDTFFPALDSSDFLETETGKGECLLKDGRFVAYRFLRLDRIVASR